MINYELLQLLETVLGNSEHKNEGNYGFKCPKCSSKYNDSKKKLEVDRKYVTMPKQFNSSWVVRHQYVDEILKQHGFNREEK